MPKGAHGGNLSLLFLEQPEGSPLIVKGGDTVSVPVHPFEIQSLRVDYPEGARYLTSSMQRGKESQGAKTKGSETARSIAEPGRKRRLLDERNTTVAVPSRQCSDLTRRAANGNLFPRLPNREGD